MRHEMGSMLLLTTGFYAFTNLYYYPYFVWVCYSVPWPIRVFCEIGFAAGFIEHLVELRGWLKGDVVEFGDPFAASPGASKLRQWVWWSFTTFLAAFGPFGIMVYEFHSARPNLPLYEFAAVIILYLGVTVFGVNSTSRGKLIGCTRQWHFEHVIVHAGFSFFSLWVGGVYDGWDQTVLRVHLLVLVGMTLLLEAMIVVADSRAKLAEKAKAQ